MGDGERLAMLNEAAMRTSQGQRQPSSSIGRAGSCSCVNRLTRKRVSVLLAKHLFLACFSSARAALTAASHPCCRVLRAVARRLPFATVHVVHDVKEVIVSHRLSKLECICVTLAYH